MFMLQHQFNNIVETTQLTNAKMPNARILLSLWK